MAYNALSNSIIPNPLQPTVPKDWGFATHTQNSNLNNADTGIICMESV